MRLEAVDRDEPLRQYAADDGARRLTLELERSGLSAKARSDWWQERPEQGGVSALI